MEIPMAISLETALKPIIKLLGKPCEIDNTGAKIQELNKEVWSIRLFDWRTCGFLERFIEEFGDYLSEDESGLIDEDQEWKDSSPVPFAFIGVRGGGAKDYPDQMTAILYFDLKKGKGDRCPVLAGYSDDFDLTKVFNSVADANIRLKKK
jgi:hypothetical protein